MKTRYLLISGLLIILGFLWHERMMRSQLPAGDRVERYRKMSVDAETQGLAESFKGMTTGGSVVPGLFPIRSTGVSTEPARKAANAFLESLSADLRAKTVFPVDDSEWRKWMNQHFYLRQGVSFKEMSEAQREAAIGSDARVAQCQGIATDARHHAAEPYLG